MVTFWEGVCYTSPTAVNPLNAWTQNVHQGRNISDLRVICKSVITSVKIVTISKYFASLTLSVPGFLRLLIFTTNANFLSSDGRWYDRCRWLNVCEYQLVDILLLASGVIFGQLQISFQLGWLQRICGLWKELAVSGQPIMLIDGGEAHQASFEREDLVLTVRLLPLSVEIKRFGKSQ